MTPNIKSKYLPFLSKKRIIAWKSTCLKDCDYINLNINDTNNENAKLPFYAQ